MKVKVLGLGVFAAVIALLLIYCTPSEADSPHGSVETIEWSLDDGTLFFSGQGEIPDEGEWDSFMDEVMGIDVAYGITSIASSAFRDYEFLESVELPGSLMRIDNRAFMNCISLSDITIPEGVTIIGDNAFANCVSLTSVHIPASVSMMSGEPFSECTSLMNVSIDPENMMYRQNGSMIVSDDGRELKIAPLGWAGTLTIPDGVESIPSWFFYKAKMSGIWIPDSVVECGNSAFRDCDYLTDVRLPERMVELSDSMFNSCTSIETITVPDSVTRIGDHTFNNCYSLRTVNLPIGLTEVGAYAFSSCANLEFIEFPSKTLFINGNAFDGSMGLREIVFRGDAGFTGGGLEIEENTGSTIYIYSNREYEGVSLTEVCNLPLDAYDPDLHIVSLDYNNTVDELTIESEMVSEGEWVSFQITMIPTYEIASVSYALNEQEPILLTENNGSYGFVMPAGNVKIIVEEVYVGYQVPDELPPATWEVDDGTGDATIMGMIVGAIATIIVIGAVIVLIAKRRP